MRYRSRLHIDLNIFANNIDALKGLSKSNILFMVKADGYGHGAIPLVRFAKTEMNITEFGCATLGEAMQLREELSDLEFETYVFSDVQLEDKELSEVYLNHRIIPVISSLSSLNLFLNDDSFRHFPLALHFNTGMNRLGIPSGECDRVIEQIKKAGRRSVYHLMTHFACASLPMDKNKRNLHQRSEFERLKKEFSAAGLEVERTSISNSGAIEQKVGLDESHIRPGLMLYGPSSLLPQYRDLSCWKGQIISALETYIIDTFPCERGTPVGYGATPTPQEGTIAIIALGYGDGLSTAYQGVEVEYGGKTGKIVGRVNMDMAQVLFPPDSDIMPGQPLSVWNYDRQQIDRICQQTGLIPYELFCQLTTRVPRVYSYR